MGSFHPAWRRSWSTLAKVPEPVLLLAVQHTTELVAQSQSLLDFWNGYIKELSFCTAFLRVCVLFAAAGGRCNRMRLVTLSNAQVSQKAGYQAGPKVMASKGYTDDGRSRHAVAM